MKELDGCLSNLNRDLSDDKSASRNRSELRTKKSDEKAKRVSSLPPLRLHKRAIGGV